MPSGREMELWWSGEAESMFVYYLTGALGIALIASITLTRSLRRKEPLVTELLHEDNVREELLTYMLKIVTSPLSGCDCPASVKVFMQVTGDKKMSQYFQIRSNTGGKAMLQRGFTDIFMFKVPESVGEIMCVKLLIAGLDGQLKWRIEEAHLYSPSTKERKTVPVIVKLLEVLDCSKNIQVQHSAYSLRIKSQLLYHQWLAMYGNTTRVGAFTEIVHVMSVFMSIFTLLILSQMCYIYLPRGEVTLSSTVASTTEDEDDNSGTFDINLLSLFIATTFSTVCCCLFTLGLEILTRSVKSREKNPGNAYHRICNHEIRKGFRKTEFVVDDEEHKTYFTHPLFLRFKTNGLGEGETLENIEKPMNERKHTEEIALYIKRLVYSLQIEHKKYFKMLEVLKSIKAQEASEGTANEKGEQEEDSLTLELPTFSEISWSEPGDEMRTTEKEKYEMNKLRGYKSEKEFTIAFPRLSYIWSSGSYNSVDSRSSCSLKSSFHSYYSSSISRPSHTKKQPHVTYLDVLKRKRISLNTGRNTSQNANRGKSLALRRNISYENQSKTAGRVRNKSDGAQIHSQHEGSINTNYNSTVNSDDLNGSVEYFENTSTHENLMYTNVDKIFDIAVGEIDNTMEALDRNINANIDNAASTSETGEKDLNVSVNEIDRENSEVCSVDIANDDLTNLAQSRTDLMEGSQSLETFKRTLNWIKESEENFRKAWQFDQKTWCRQVVKELCDIIRCTREMLLKDQINFYVLKEKLLHNSNTVVQLFMVACSVNCTADQFKKLSSSEMVSLLWHMALEISAYVLQELFQVFEQRDNAVLADLVLQSHSVMLAVNHAVYPVVYLVKYGTDKGHLMNHIPLDKDVESIIVELLKGCFQLVVKYNLVLWQKLHFLVEMELRDCLDVDCYSHLNEFVEGNIIDQTAEDIVLKKLCNQIEESSKQEAWEEVHEEKIFFTTILVKIQFLKALKNKIARITKKKDKFDEAHDLLPKEPKSRLQLLVERRRKPVDVEVKHVTWNKLEPDGGDNSEESKEKLEEQSKLFGDYVENLTCIFDKLKRLMERQGLSMSIKAAEYLAQAVLHPHVIVLPGKVDEPGMYTFNNYLHLKRTEVLVAQYYEATGKDLMNFVLTTAIKEHNLHTEKLEQPDSVLNNIIIKIDTMAQLLQNDVETIMHECIKKEQCHMTLDDNKYSQIGSAVNTSVSSLLQTPVLKQWSSQDLKSSTSSEILGSSRIQEDSGDRSVESLPDMEITIIDHNNSNIDTVDIEDIDLEVDTRNVTLTDILEDLRPLKGYIDYVKHGEMMRNLVTQMGYIERTKSKREYVSSIQINNIIDSYFMLDEGDDSKTLTKSGLYQLEYDCTGEVRKPLGSWVKVVLVMFMLVLQIFIVVYITMIGGQFTTTELQEWMCYFLLAVAVFGLVFEPVRASIVALYVRKLHQKLWP